MYPVPPQSHRHTRYYGILIACIVAMLIVLFGGLRNISDRLSQAGTATGQPTAQLFGQPRAGVTPLALITPTAQPAAAATAAAALPTPTASDVSPADLAAAPANFRSRAIRVQGKVYYVGKTDDGKTWIQISDNASPPHYINGSFAGTMPAAIAKGSDVVVSGIGAGLTAITAADGHDYDEPMIDPVQKVELAGATSASNPAP